MARVYVASSWRNDYQPQVVRVLRNHGHEVYDFRDPEGGTAFAWSAIDPKWEEWAVQEFAGALWHPVAQAGFASDMDALRAAEYVVLVLPSGRSAHLEAGWAVGAGKRVVAFVPERIEPELMYAMFDSICESVGQLVAALGRSPS